MPQRDATRASNATTGAVPATGPARGPDGGAPLVRADAASTSPPRSTGAAGGLSTGTVPSEQIARPGDRADGGWPVDQRAAARAGLAAGRSPSLWWVCTGIVAVLVVTFAVGVTEGALLLAALLAVSALARAVLRPGPVALTVRSRAVDCAVLTVLAVGVGLLARLAPTG